MRLLPTSVRTRLTLGYTLALAVPLVAFGIVSYLIFSSTVRARTDAFVEDALTVFGRELSAERHEGLDLKSAIRRTLREVRFREADILILDDAGSVVGTSGPLGTAGALSEHAAPVDPAVIVTALGPHPEQAERITTMTHQGGAYRVVLRPLRLDGRTYHLVGVHSLARVAAMLTRIRRLFLVLMALIIVVAAAGGSFLARRSFLPVTAMATRAAEIGASTLHERLPVVAKDELGELACVLNELLDRLALAFEQQRRFMADASHELRTPTAIVRTEADVILSREHRTEEEYRDSLEIVRNASRRLTRIVDDVFLSARADAGHLVMNPEPLYLEDLVGDTVRAVGPIAEARRVRVELGELVEAPAVADAELLSRVLLNLLDNAIKHSPQGRAVEVSMSAGGGSCEIAIVDHGPGIPEEARERVFERFFRVDVARSREESTLTGGAGLGLSISRRIAEMHGGRLFLVGSRPGNTEFRVSLPLEGSGPEGV